MGYIAQKTRPAALTIGGQDYTSSMVDWVATDASANKRGLIVTTGTLTLGQRPGEVDIENYDRDLFKRGTLVTLDITYPDKVVRRHPRGYLYVTSVVYNAESEQLEIQLGCRLALAYLNEDISSIIDLVPIYLDPAQRTIQNCSASFAAAGMYLYQDNQGSLVSGSFFDGDNTSGITAGAWVSILGETALSVSPLNGGDPIPDKIELSYQVPSDVISEDQTGRVETTEEISNYFLSYPAATYDRIDPNESEPDFQNPTIIDDITTGGGTSIPPFSGSSTSGCGNTPSPPSTSGAPLGSAPDPDGDGDGDEETTPVDTAPVACNAGWTTVSAPTFVGVENRSIAVTEYSGPAAQVSFMTQEVYGPAIEVNGQYYADKFAYCTQVHGYACNPNGNCPMEGLETVLQRRTTQQNFYGEANELVKQIDEEYIPVLAAAQPFDWRSGVLEGAPQDFNDTLTADQLFRATVKITEYYQEGNSNIQFSTLYTSIATRGGGIKEGAGSLDALQGIKTTNKRTSTTITTLDIKPDTVNTVTTSTTEMSTDILLGPSTYLTPPSEAGPYVLEEAVPVPLLFTLAGEEEEVGASEEGDSEAEEQPETGPDFSRIDAVVSDYSEYLTRFIKGDLYGLKVAEALRPEIAAGWYPGMPFRYVDQANDTISAMRMDACNWGVTQNESIVVTNGIWNGFSGGTLVFGSNLTGNSRPDMSVREGNANKAIGGDRQAGNPQPPGLAPQVPGIIDDSVGQTFFFEVDIDLTLQAFAETYGDSGIVPIMPSDLTSDIKMTLVVFSSGSVVQAGSTVATTGAGGVPLNYAGSLLTADAVLVVSDLFA